MRNYKMFTLLIMGVLALILVIMVFVFYSSGTMTGFFGLYISAGFLIIDLIAMLSFVLVILFWGVGNNTWQIIKSTFIVSICIMMVIVAVIASDPLRRSNTHIREQVLKITPIGTNMENVIEIIENNDKWEIENVYYGSDYTNQKPLSPELPTESEGSPTWDKSILVLGGEYRTIFITSVTIFWEFDEDSKLIEINIRAYIDAF